MYQHNERLELRYRIPSAKKKKTKKKICIVNALLAKNKKDGDKSGTAGTGQDKYAKYARMKKIGLPDVSIRNKMKMDGISDIEIAKYFGDPLPKSASKGATVDLSKHDLSKYDKMKKIGMPEGSVRNKMKMDGIDAKVVAAYFGDPIPADKNDDDEDGDEIDLGPIDPPGPEPDLSKFSLHIFV